MAREDDATVDDTDDPIDLGRLLTLTDGVFAIAITLLVLDLALPTGLRSEHDVDRSLSDLVPNFAAFVLSFLVIGRYWIGHHFTFRRISRVDVTLMWINLALLGTIALLPFTTSALAEYGEYAIPTIMYATNLAAAAFLSAVVHWYAGARLHHEAVASPVESGTLSVAVVFLLSIPIAVFWPNGAKLFWCVLFFVDPVVTRISRARQRSRGTAGR